MTALSYSTTRDDGESRITKLPIAAQKVLRGSLACINASGYAIKGANTAGYRFTGGYFTDEVDNSAGSAGDLSCEIALPRIMKIATSGAGQSSIGRTVYLTDDNTVQFTETYVPVGICVDYESATSIWVAPFLFGIGISDDTGAIESSPIELDCAVANDENDLIPAYKNNGPTGMFVEHVYGLVTEVPAGAGEDQPVVTIYDEDNTSLGTITFADGSGDTIGDKRLGFFIADSAQLADGGALKTVAAGKKIYAKVTTPTSGAGAVGGVKVFCRCQKY
jgi:hypothetical protein